MTKNVRSKCAVINFLRTCSAYRKVYYQITTMLYPLRIETAEMHKIYLTYNDPVLCYAF